MAETCNEITRVGIWFPSWTCSCWVTKPRIGRASQHYRACLES